MKHQYLASSVSRSFLSSDSHQSLVSAHGCLFCVWRAVARFPWRIRSERGRLSTERLCRLTLPMPSEPHATFASDIGNKWLAGWTSTIPSVVTSATREEQCERIPFLGGADFTYYKPSEQNTFFTAYPECNGYDHFKVVSVTADTVWLSDISHCIGFIQFLVLVDYPYRLADIAGEHTEQVGNLKLRHPHGCGGQVFFGCQTVL